MWSYIIIILLLAAFYSPAQAMRCSGRNRPRLIRVNPPTMFDPTPLGYSHITVDTHNAVATVAGQVAINKAGDIVGTTLAQQLREIERSLGFALAAVNADVEDIFKLNAYILNFDPSTDLDIYIPTSIRLGSPPGTLISTPALAIEGLLAEIEISVALSRRDVRKLACQSDSSVERNTL